MQRSTEFNPFGKSKMKTRIVLALVAVSMAVYSSMACSVAECGGGPDMCCIKPDGTIYKITVKQDVPVDTPPGDDDGW